ncbi:odorant receptor 82a-like [Solenopsis invicta]|uniref:odorant receptor 82a-like n=1 Tax=Solenopsis invicta TaxID=13686 RepID=UPI00193E59F9|nr:odorant receptor 82a-like [Solenopsis invicta]
MKRAYTISRSIEIGLRFIGMWPDSAYPNLYWFSYVTTVAIVQYYQYTYIFVHFDSNNLWLLMDCLSLSLAYSLAFLKLLVLWWNRRIFHYIVKMIDQDWNEYIINDLHRSIMTSMAGLSRRFANITFSFYAFSAFFLTIGEHLIQSMDDGNQFSNNSRELPIKMEFPFDVSKSPIFECLLIGQFLYDMVIAFVVGLINALLVASILHVTGQIEIMQQDLIEISNGKYDRATFILVIKSLICKHQKIITLSENIETLFTHIALMQVLWNTLVMCCTGFVIVVIVSNGEDTTNLIKSVSYYIAIIMEVFVYCFAGEFLSAKSKSIGDAVYESLWYNLPPSDSRIILFMMLRCQKRLTITAGRVFDLTLEGFTSIMKASVSYVSVLNAMY